jgi:hypothetical protein
LEVTKHSFNFIERSYCRQPIQELIISTVKWCNQIFLKITYSVSKLIEIAEIVETEKQKGCKNTQIRVRLSFKEDIENTEQSENQQSDMNKWIVELRSDDLVIDG